MRRGQMSESRIVIVTPIYKGGIPERRVIAEAVWAAMPPGDRVVFDYGACFPGLIPSEYDLGNPPKWRDLESAISTAASSMRGTRLLRGDEPLPGDEALIESLSEGGLSVLITTRWFLSTHGRGEQALTGFLARSAARMVGYVYAAGSGSATERVASLHEAAGDRLLTIYRPAFSEAQPRFPGLSVPALISSREPLPEWLTSIVREHAGLPIRGRASNPRDGGKPRHSRP